jgi:hypothetical protein
MILINRDSANTVVLRLYENVTISTPTFLFSFTSQENEQVNFISADVSIYPNSYNKFVITEIGTGVENFLTANIILQPTGQWKYEVYAQSSTTNLNPANADEILESGIVIVKDDANPVVEYESPASNTDTYIIPNE